MHPELIHIGSFALPSYGVMMALGFLAALWLLRKRPPRSVSSRTRRRTSGSGFSCRVSVGAKLLLVHRRVAALRVVMGGLKDLARAGGVFYGGLIGALVGTAILLRKRSIPFFTFADLAAPSVALGQCLGRVGCLLAGCCWAASARCPGRSRSPTRKRPENVGVPLGIPLHPTQIYEAVGTLILCILLVVFERRRYSGETFVRYLFGYAILRFTIEIFRGDPRGSVFGAMSTSQFIALGLAAGAAAIWALRRRTAPAPAAVRSA